MSDTTQSSLTVLIDYENLALGTGRRKRNGYQEVGPAPDIKCIFEQLVEKVRITAKRAYRDWQRFSDAIVPLHKLDVELIEIHQDTKSGTVMVYGFSD